MRYAIFSDVHSNLEALEAIIEAYRKENIDKYLCVGDVVGYAANPGECIAKVKELAMITIAGNHDWASVDLFSLDYFNPHAKAAVTWTKRNLTEAERIFLQSLQLVYKNDDLTLVHGTLSKPQEFDYMIDGYQAAETFRLLESHICFIGHSHVAGIFIMDEDKRMDYQETAITDIKENNKYIVNVGSVGQPRDGDPRAAYCIYDTTQRLIQIKRADYDIKTARKKIIDAGLPQFLGNRLLVGR